MICPESAMRQDSERRKPSRAEGCIRCMGDKPGCIVAPILKPNMQKKKTGLKPAFEYVKDCAYFFNPMEPMIRLPEIAFSTVLSTAWVTFDTFVILVVV